MKTVTQLAEELNVNRTTLHRLIQRNNIETLQEGNKRLIDTASEQAIIQAFKSKSLHNETLQSNNETLQSNNKVLQQKVNEQGEQLADLRRHITEQNNQIESLRRQLSDTEKKLDEYKHKVSALTEFNNLHHKTIDRLEKENNKLNERLDKAETERAGFLNNISELTIALKAAQALHGMDKQQAAIELKEPAEQATQDQSEPPRKTSLFSRLFRRTK